MICTVKNSCVARVGPAIVHFDAENGRAGLKIIPAMQTTGKVQIVGEYRADVQIENGEVFVSNAGIRV